MGGATFELFCRRSVSRAVVDGQPYNSFCRLERGEIVLSQVLASSDLSALSLFSPVCSGI